MNLYKISKSISIIIIFSIMSVMPNEQIGFGQTFTHKVIFSSHNNEKIGNTYVILGEVKNVDTVSHTEVKVVANVFDSNNNLIGTKTVSLEPSDIDPGNTSPFRIVFDNSDVPDTNMIDSYHEYVSYK